MYRGLRLLDPLIRSWRAADMPGLGVNVVISAPGRRTGRIRSTLLTLLSVDGRWYVGHPNGSAAWGRNIETSGWADVDPPSASGPRVAVHRVDPGVERDAVIRAALQQQPFPANLVYRAARRHVAAVGVYYRLEPIALDATSTSAAGPPDEGAR
jgi:hypothetical protein